MSKEIESALARFGNKSEQANHSCFWKGFMCDRLAISCWTVSHSFD